MRAYLINGPLFFSVYKPIGSKMLALSDDLKTYEEGKQFCSVFGGVMVRVDNQAVNDAIASEFLDY